jgi:hypothetical protein
LASKSWEIIRGRGGNSVVVVRNITSARVLVLANVDKTTSMQQVQLHPRHFWILLLLGEQVLELSLPPTSLYAMLAWQPILRTKSRYHTGSSAASALEQPNLNKTTTLSPRIMIKLSILKQKVCV